VTRAPLAALALLAAGTAACTGDIDPPWQLDHDRIVAVRAEPPAIPVGRTSQIDVLLAQKGGTTSVAAPDGVAVVTPASLSDVVSRSSGNWVVTAPSEDRLAAARAELKLDAGAPVPLQIGVQYMAKKLFAVKTIELGRSADNPGLAGMAPMIDGKAAGEAEIAVGKLVKVPLSVNADDAAFDVAWLTSCGTMHDFDLPTAYLKVETDDPDAGQLAVVVRDGHGGVSWQIWPIHAE